MSKKLILFLLLPFVFSIPLQGNASKLPSVELTNIYQLVLKDPGNQKLLYRYAQKAIQDGNFEAAIGALECMLIDARNQPQVLLRLGTLYQRLGVPKMAKKYLLKAKKLSTPNSRVYNIANEYIAQIDRKTSSHILSGTLRIGARYQSNPNFSPGDLELLSGGTLVTQSDTKKRDSDVNAMFSSYLRHRYNLTPQTSLASEMYIYATAYDNNSKLNVGSVDLSFGPQFQSRRNASSEYTIRPMVILRGTYLDGSRLEETLGAGLEYSMLIGSESRIYTRYQFRDINYKDYDDTGLKPLHSGNRHRLDLRFSKEYIRGHLIEIGLTGRYHEAEQDCYTNEQYGAHMRYSVKLENVIFPDQPKMLLTPYIIYRHTDYDTPDLSVDPSIEREDRDWRFGVYYKLPFTNPWSLFFNYEHRRVDSNIINYDADNDSGMICLQMGF